MNSSSTYQLFGYIEYLPESIGFVTPVFKNEEDAFYVQVLLENTNQNWQLLSEEYQNHITPVQREYISDDFDFTLYGFKWENRLFFGPGELMADYLEKSFLAESSIGLEVAKAFLQDWIALEPKKDFHFSQTAWQMALDYIGEESKILSAIFANNFLATSFDQHHLLLKTQNESVKDLFDDKFRDLLIPILDKRFRNIKITVLLEGHQLMPILPFTYFDNQFYGQGSFIMQTSVMSHQNFDNYVITRHNSSAYEKALLFLREDSPSIFIISGDAGTGKSHLMNSIAQKVSQTKTKSVGMFKVLSNSTSNPDIDNHEFVKFKFAIEDYDLIFIDDAHFIPKGKLVSEEFLSVLTMCSTRSKKIVMCFRDSYELNFNIDFEQQQIYLNKIQEADRHEFIKFKSLKYKLLLDVKTQRHLAKQHTSGSLFDLQREIIRCKTLEKIAPLLKNSIFSADLRIIDFFTLQSSVFRYFAENTDSEKCIKSELRTVCVKTMTFFLKDIFNDPRRRTNSHSYIVLHKDSFFYSYDRLQHYFFENERFRDAVIEILSDALIGDDERE